MAFLGDYAAYTACTLLDANSHRAQAKAMNPLTLDKAEDVSTRGDFALTPLPLCCVKAGFWRSICQTDGIYDVVWKRRQLVFKGLLRKERGEFMLFMQVREMAERRERASSRGPEPEFFSAEGRSPLLAASVQLIQLNHGWQRSEISVSLCLQTSFLPRPKDRTGCY